jgi:ABC-type multidrug transport system permease subunit
VALRENPIWQLTLVKVREYLREPEAIFWILLFPVLLALALGVAFRSHRPEPVLVGVTEGPGAAEVLSALREDPQVRAQELPQDAARIALANGKVALVVLPGTPPTYWFDPTREESRVARLVTDAALQRAAGRLDPLQPATRELTEKGSRYIDFLLPGLLGMNLMGTGMWGIGFAIVSARSKGMLKRMVASPMRKSHYLLAQMLGRIALLIPEAGLLLGFGHFAFGVPMRGSLLLVAVLALMGALSFAGLGLLVAARPRTIEGVSGLMNVVMMPMWLLSGTFFSNARFPDALQPFVQALPLTALNDALRAVLLEGAGITAIAGEAAILVGWGIAAFGAALVLFRWR